jgi:DNA-binding SARP family transcriptional activator
MFPKSARIATVRARLTSSVEDAQRAISVDPQYGPAVVALAAALLKRGDVDGAKRTIESVKSLERISDGYKVEAEILLAARLPKAAAEAARKQISRGSLNPIEPDAGDPRPLREANSLLKRAAEGLATRR